MSNRPPSDDQHPPIVPPKQGKFSPKYDRVETREEYEARMNAMSFPALIEQAHDLGIEIDGKSKEDVFDAVERAKRLRLFKERYPDSPKDYFSEEFLAKKKEFVDRMVDEMTKKAPWQWRLTSEQKPDIQVHVLTVNNYGDVTVGKMTGVGTWYDMADTNWDGDPEQIEPAPTHWMPMPDKP